MISAIFIAAVFTAQAPGGGFGGTPAPEDCLCTKYEVLRSRWREKSKAARAEKDAGVKDVLAVFTELADGPKPDGLPELSARAAAAKKRLIAADVAADEAAEGLKSVDDLEALHDKTYGKGVRHPAGPPAKKAVRRSTGR